MKKIDTTKMSSEAMRDILVFEKLDEIVDKLNSLEKTGDENIVWYGPHPCQECDPDGKKGTMIVKAGNGADKSLEFNFVHDSQYPNHKWIRHAHLA